MVEVTQADRKAAAQLVSKMGDTIRALNILSGNLDDAPEVQAFAVHRIAERERCARVAEDWTMDWTRESAHIPSDIAQAIRIGE